MDTERWAVVCDPGIDDAVALAVLVGLGAVPDLVVSEPGNVSGATAARHAAGLVALLGVDVPVRAFRGTHPAAVRPGRGSRHGDDGLGGMAHRLPEAPVPGRLESGELPGSVLVTGSLACVTASDRAYERLVWMGGSLGGGNITPDAEFNAWCAPDAADEVLRASGPGTRVVPLDVTCRVVVDPEHLAGGASASLLADALRVRAAAPVHDAVAAVAWLRPDLFEWKDLALRCEVTDDRRGAIVMEGPGPTRVAVGLDAVAVRRLVVDAVNACP